MMTARNSWCCESTWATISSICSAPPCALATGTILTRKSWSKLMAEMTLVREPMSIPTKSVDTCCQYLTRVGLCANDYLDREVDASLSGGEVKRIEIASILARGASLMIFDEPEAGIDLWSFAKLTETFRYIHDKREATIIIISHQERIIGLADEIVLVADGLVSEQGPREEIFPKILANTQPGCAFVGEEGQA